MKKLNIGIIGSGFIADWHFKGFAQNKNAEIVGITRDYHGTRQDIDRQKTQLEDKARHLGIKAYETYERMLEDNSIDALIIASVNPYHYEQIKAAIKVDKPIMVEKPVLTDLNELAEIQAICQESSFKLFPAHNFVYRKAIPKAKEE
jgi:predicted dehydrogenase